MQESLKPSSVESVLQDSTKVRAIVHVAWAAFPVVLRVPQISRMKAVLKAGYRRKLDKISWFPVSFRFLPEQRRPT